MPTKTNRKSVRKIRSRIALAEPRSAGVVQTPVQLKQLPANTLLYALTIFLGAFLLFQVQLILGKFVLPRFGGGSSFWSASLLTFQCLLLAGYGYAAFLTQRFDRRMQTQIHFGLLAASALLIILVTLKWH